MFRCPWCGNKLFSYDSDIDNEYFTCCACGRQYNFDETPRAMTPAELKDRYGIKLTEYHKSAKIRLE